MGWKGLYVGLSWGLALILFRTAGFYVFVVITCVTGQCLWWVYFHSGSVSFQISPDYKITLSSLLFLKFNTVYPMENLNLNFRMLGKIMKMCMFKYLVSWSSLLMKTRNVTIISKIMLTKPSKILCWIVDVHFTKQRI